MNDEVIKSIGEIGDTEVAGKAIVGLLKLARLLSRLLLTHRIWDTKLVLIGRSDTNTYIIQIQIQILLSRILLTHRLSDNKLAGWY